MLTSRLQPIFLSLIFSLSLQSGVAQQTVAELNYVHDKMIVLMNQSGNIVLPPGLEIEIKAINKNQVHGDKLSSVQLNFLKVMFNTNLSKEDIRFFGEQLLKNNSNRIVPIHAMVKKQLDLL